MNIFVVLKKLSSFLALKAWRSLTSLVKFICTKRTIVFVTNNKINSYSLGAIPQIAILSFAFWVGSLFNQSLQYDAVVRSKVDEISDLKKANEKFESEVNSLNSNLSKINDYFTSISGYDHLSSGQESDKEIKNTGKKFQELFGDISLNKNDKEIAEKIASSSAMIDSINLSAVRRINSLEQKIAITGLKLADNNHVSFFKGKSEDLAQQVTSLSLNSKEDLKHGQGGPLIRSKNTSSWIEKVKGENENAKNSIEDEVAYLAKLEKFVYQAPLSKPMKNYYVSSGFGERSDPINGHGAIHHGMDFVGTKSAQIISPSPGKVILAEKFGAYGNAIVIDHGYGITTRYGHLSKIKVAEGDRVLRGQVIGVQGSTGRSTGPHLHYEVRYNNTPLNPKKFLKAGQEIFNDDQTVKHVES